MKITFDEICDAADNPGSMSFKEYNRILRGAIEMIKETDKDKQNLILKYENAKADIKKAMVRLD